MKHHGNYNTADVNDIASNNVCGYIVYVRQALKKKMTNTATTSAIRTKKRKLVDIHAYNRRNK